MTYFKTAGTATVIATLLSSTAAYADFTAEGAWDQFVSMMAEQGATVTAGSETTSGNVFTATDVIFDFDLDLDEALELEEDEIPTVTFTMPSAVFTENGDGTVAMTHPEDSRLSVILPDTAEVDEIAATMSSKNMVTTFSGETDDYTLDYVADEFSIRLDPIVSGSVTFDPKVVASVTAFKGTVVRKVEDLIHIESNSTIENISVTADFELPDDEGAFKMDATLSDLVSSSTATQVPGVNMQDTVAQLKGGMAVDGKFAYGAAAVNVFAKTPDGPFDVTMVTGGGTGALQLDKDGFAYSGTGSDITETVSLVGLGLPPMSIALAASEIGLSVPFSSEEAGDFGLVTKLSGLTIDDGIWSMFDPQAILPRDAIDFTLDGSGTFKWLIDIFAPDAEDQLLENEMPVELNTFNLNEFLLSAAGAKATGSGAVTFDLTDTVSFDGMPAPIGSFSFTLEGANGVLDKIVEMGFISAEEAMGARMMSGMFMKPGEGDDVLTSDIDLTEDKQVLINGTRIK